MKRRMLTVLTIAGLILGVAMGLSGPVQSQPPSDRYTKTSVDNTPLFVYTDTQNGCKYVYNSINRAIRVAKGYEHCTVPKSLE